MSHNGRELRIEVTSLTFSNGEGDESFAALTMVGSHFAYGAMVDPDPVRFVSGRVTDIAGRHVANVSESTVGLSMPVSGFTKPNTFCIVLTLPNTVIQDSVTDNEVNVKIVVTTNLTYGSGFIA